MTLKRNEILTLALGGLFVLTLLYYFFVISPAAAREKDLDRYIKKTRADLAEMVELKTRWDLMKRNQVEAEKMIGQRGPKFTLLSYLESISRETGINDKIQYMKPMSFPEESGPLKQEGMEIKLEGVDMTQLVNYLYKIEYSEKLLSIVRIKVQRESTGDESSLLKATLQVNTYVQQGA